MRWGRSELLTTATSSTKFGGFIWVPKFTRSLFGTEDMARHMAILARMAWMVDDGIIKAAETRILNGLPATTLREAQKAGETGALIGKSVVAY